MVTRRAATTVASSPLGPGTARRFVTRALEDWGFDGDLVETARLVVSELVTNTIAHARGSDARLSVCDEGESVVIEVHDEGPGTPAVRRVAPDTLGGGRGLAIVEAMTAEWGVRRERSGKVVWARLASDASESAGSR